MSPRQQDEETVRVGTSEVVVDVVVRDKNDRHVKDLTAADFEIHEDGVRQQVQSFRLVTREEAAAATAAPGPGAPATGVVAIVFDRLSPDARARAGKAALSYVGAGPGGNDFVGVFAIDQSLRALQPFTTDRQLVRRAVERAAG
ncbi:MAG TPA: VWA domain-containing protein, partial [Pyrinomonadaceae bacterium]|nr:VWA domain-containing protein [Pyrinomonadaceae bacterium]